MEREKTTPTASVLCCFVLAVVLFPVFVRETAQAACGRQKNEKSFVLLVFRENFFVLLVFRETKNKNWARAEKTFSHEPRYFRGSEQNCADVASGVEPAPERKVVPE
jgi:hypothetical protein